MRRNHRREGEALFLALTELYGRGRTDAEIAHDLDVVPRTFARWRAAQCVPAPKIHAVSDFLAEHAIDWQGYLSKPRPVYSFDMEYWEAVRQGPPEPPPLPAHVPSLEAKFLGMRLDSPIGVSASIATASSEWVEYWARVYYDVITYKTTRAVTSEYAPHPFPNVVYLPDEREPWRVGDRPAEAIVANRSLEASITPGQPLSLANSVGMPSFPPKVWMPDVDRAKERLGATRCLIVSVVGTGTDRTTMLTNFAHCAALAAQTQADVVELNGSCPNVYESEGDKIEGSLYQDPKACATLLKQVHKAMKGIRREKPVLLKIGYLEPGPLEALVRETRRLVAGYTAINTLATNVLREGRAPGSPPTPCFSRGGKAIAGVSGIAIREHAISVIEQLNQLRTSRDEYCIVGVGGISSPDDVVRFLKAGADVIQSCTAAMFDRTFAVRSRQALADAFMYPVRGGQPPTQRLQLASEPKFAKWADGIREAAFELDVDLRVADLEQLILEADREFGRTAAIGAIDASAVRARRTDPPKSYWLARIRDRFGKASKTPPSA